MQNLEDERILRQGYAYFSGVGVEKNLIISFRKFAEIAKRGNPVGQYRVGLALYEGLGIPKDQQEAINWFRQASNQGNISAKHALAMAYFNGEGVRQDRLKAIEMFKVAALQNNSDSIAIGSLNGNGEVLKKVLIRLSLVYQSCNAGYASTFLTKA